jgi:hypothetical protein
MSTWHQFLSDVHTHVEDLRSSGCDMPFFRGHSDSSWKLLPGLGRQAPEHYKKQNIESILYYDFISLGGSLLGKSADSWDILFAMQHHGLPTRLLDWSTTFAAALYFALKPYLPLRNFPEIKLSSGGACVWILDPFELNRSSQNEPAVLNPYTDLDGTYQENFIEGSKNLGAKVLAINPPQHSPRQSAQRSVFTLHDELFQPLDEFSGSALRKFNVPAECLQDGLSFLSLAGINEFSIFPDLDGLARHLKGEHVNWL